MELGKLSIKELMHKIKSREISVVEVTQASLDRVDEVEPKIDAFLSVARDSAMDDARQLQKKIDSGDCAGNLLGVPIGVKDVICTNGLATTAGSKMLEGWTPPYDATVVKNVRDNNAILIGKTNCDEFAMGSSGENSAYKPTRNPWNLERVPGGSSSGSAAAVASGEVMCSLGSDTGGSVRQPASLCGLVGIKPTYGLVSRYGLIAYASSFDQVGAFTRSVEDMAYVMNAICGTDTMDSTSVVREKEDYTKALTTDVKDMRIGVPKEFFADGLDDEIRRSVLAAVEKFEQLGAAVEECSLAIARYALATYYVVACAEASSNLARFDGIRYGYRASNAATIEELYKKTRWQGFGDEVKRRIFLGTSVLSAGYSDQYYKKAQKTRNLIKQLFAQSFKRYDLLITPTSPCEAFKFGEKTDNPLEMYLADIYTVPINTAGVPAISIPCGFTKSGLPIGLQLIGDYFSESKILAAAHAYEQSTDWAQMPAVL